MRTHRLDLPRWLVVMLGLALGGTAATAVASLVGPAAAQQPTVAAGAVLDATHVPPLLSLPGEQVDLAYDVHCAAGDATGDVGCILEGSVFARASGTERFAELPLTARSADGIRRLTTSVPESLASHRGGFEYFAVIEAPELALNAVVPAAGADAPHVSRRLENSIEIALGRHRFGAGRRASQRVALARWGDSGGSVGLEQGRSVSPIGASAFDVDASGAVAVLDQAHRRLLRWPRGHRTPERIPLAVTGTLADMAASTDGSVYVLESVAEPGRNPLVRRFDDAGRELEAIETAERTASQIRMSPRGPLVLSQPSNHWTPVMIDGVPASRAAQLRAGRAGRTVDGGAEVVVFRHANELRLALVSGRAGVRSWRLTSETPLAEVQLAEPAGRQLVVVLRVYDEPVAEFFVVVLDESGLRDRFAVDSADWAEAAPLGRFKLARGSLYRLGSTPVGAFVDRFDLEVS